MDVSEKNYEGKCLLKMSLTEDVLMEHRDTDQNMRKSRTDIISVGDFLCQMLPRT